MINHLIMSLIKPTLNQTSFFWRINYYDDVFFSNFSCIPPKHPTGLKLRSDKDSWFKIKNNYDSSDRTRAKTIFKISHQKPIGLKTDNFPLSEVVFRGMSMSDLMTLSLLVFEFETKGPKNPMSVSDNSFELGQKFKTKTN